MTALEVAALILALCATMLTIAGCTYILVRSLPHIVQAIGASIALSALKDDADERRAMKRGDDDWEGDDVTKTPVRPSLLDYTPEELIAAAVAMDDQKGKQRRGRGDREWNAEDNATQGRGDETQAFDVTGVSANGR